jgi:hypothetical protein
MLAPVEVAVIELLCDLGAAEATWTEVRALFADLVVRGTICFAQVTDALLDERRGAGPLAPANACQSGVHQEKRRAHYACDPVDGGSCTRELEAIRDDAVVAHAAMSRRRSAS